MCRSECSLLLHSSAPLSTLVLSPNLFHQPSLTPLVTNTNSILQFCWEDTTHEGTGGICPVPNCGCACVPGAERDLQIAEAEEAEAARLRARGGLSSALAGAGASGSGVVLGDERVVGESKAVERVRGAMREERTGEGKGKGREKSVKFEG